MLYYSVERARARNAGEYSRLGSSSRLKKCKNESAGLAVSALLFHHISREGEILIQQLSVEEDPPLSL